ncbi:hypothetical protein B0F90DRAFT_221576 [Multifurca ochricompacta]|uniref:Uncharacterized protein n=1 Tax=Multifurca ochricompacta TaxID=376703 RepID=A0AAD4QG18_9AGAM|nr:hypothetical protein B0F90DRAFT_221576 [Multifurca ochricompacta]
MGRASSYHRTALLLMTIVTCRMYFFFFVSAFLASMLWKFMQQCKWYKMAKAVCVRVCVITWLPRHPAPYLVIVTTSDKIGTNSNILSHSLLLSLSSYSYRLGTPSLPIIPFRLLAQCAHAPSNAQDRPFVSLGLRQ